MYRRYVDPEIVVWRLSVRYQVFSRGPGVVAVLYGSTGRFRPLVLSNSGGSGGEGGSGLIRNGELAGPVTPRGPQPLKSDPMLCEYAQAAGAERQRSRLKASPRDSAMKIPMTSRRASAMRTLLPCMRSSMGTV